MAGVQVAPAAVWCHFPTPLLGCSATASNWRMGEVMAIPNYRQEKKRREDQQRKKKEQKQQEKAARKGQVTDPQPR
jgi:hypothetical protein